MTHASFFIAGGARAGVHGHLHGGDDGEDPGRRVHLPQGQLPPQPLEHHGLHRRHIRVSGLAVARPLNFQCVLCGGGQTRPTLSYRD